MDENVFSLLAFLWSYEMEMADFPNAHSMSSH